MSDRFAATQHAHALGAQEDKRKAHNDQIKIELDHARQRNAIRAALSDRKTKK